MSTTVQRGIGGGQQSTVSAPDAHYLLNRARQAGRGDSRPCISSSLARHAGRVRSPAEKKTTAEWRGVEAPDPGAVAPPPASMSSRDRGRRSGRFRRPKSFAGMRRRGPAREVSPGFRRAWAHGSLSPRARRLRSRARVAERWEGRLRGSLAQPRAG